MSDRTTDPGSGWTTDLEYCAAMAQRYEDDKQWAKAAAWYDQAALFSVSLKYEEAAARCRAEAGRPA